MHAIIPFTVNFTVFTVLPFFFDTKNTSLFVPPCNTTSEDWLICMSMDGIKISGNIGFDETLQISRLDVQLSFNAKTTYSTDTSLPVKIMSVYPVAVSLQNSNDQFCDVQNNTLVKVSQISTEMGVCKATEVSVYKAKEVIVYEATKGPFSSYRTVTRLSFPRVGWLCTSSVDKTKYMQICIWT